MRTTILILAVLACGQAAAQCSFKGPSMGTSFTDNNATGSYVWSSPYDARQSDDVYSVAKLSMASFSEGSSHFLMATGFDFAIPAGAAICGIEVSVEKHYQVNSGALFSINDKAVQLLKNGTPVGSNKATSEAWTLVDSERTYGGSWDSWGTSWSATDINSGSFGIAFAVTVSSGSSDLVVEAMVDKINITVHYNTVLPVHFKDVRGTREQEHILLTWITASESNSSHFVVEKMINDNWKAIDSLAAAGNSAEDKSYSTIDRTPLSSNIYRIRQVDKDGRYIYSRSVRVHFSAGANIIIRNYPNPVQKVLTIESSAPFRSVQLTDQSGRVVLHKELDTAAYVTILNIASLPAGVYILQTDVSAREAAKRVVIYR